MLSFLSKKNQSFAFEPSLAIFDVKSPHNSVHHFTIRASSGDETNSTKTLRVESSDISSLELDFEGFDDYESSTDSSDALFVTGKSFLKITRHSKEIEKHLLAEHRIAVYGEAIKNKGKNSTRLNFPPISEISAEIKDIWQLEFSYCLDDLYQNNESKPKKKSSYIDKALTIFCIITILGAVIFGISKFMQKDVGSKLQTQNTLIDEMVKNPNLDSNEFQNIQTSPEHDQNQLKNTVEQETLTEFGLDSGVKLD